MITLEAVQAIMARQAEVLGGSWRASTGTEDAWGVAQYSYAELSDGGETIIRIWVNGAEAILSAEVAPEFDEANVEIWGFGEAIVEAAVAALARGDFEVRDRHVQLKAERKTLRLTKWPPGGKVPGVGW